MGSAKNIEFDFNVETPCLKIIIILLRMVSHREVRGMKIREGPRAVLKICSAFSNQERGKLNVEQTHWKTLAVTDNLRGSRAIPAPKPYQNPETDTRGHPKPRERLRVVSRQHFP